MSKFVNNLATRGGPVGGVTWAGGAPMPFNRAAAPLPMPMADMASPDVLADGRPRSPFPFTPRPLPPAARSYMHGVNRPWDRPAPMPAQPQTMPVPQGGGGSWNATFAPPAFGNGDRYNADGARPDGRHQIQGFSYKAKGLDAPMGSVNGLYAMNRTDNSPFYHTGDTNSVPQLLGSQGPKGGLKFGFGGQTNNAGLPTPAAPMPSAPAPSSGGGLDPNAWSTFDAASGQWKPDSVPKRATGGPVAPGQPYVVGEKGPEIMVPQAPGTVLPNEALTTIPGMRALNTPYGSGVAVDNGAPVSLPNLPRAVQAIQQEPGAVTSYPGAEAAMAKGLPFMPSMPAAPITKPVLTTNLDTAQAMMPPGVDPRAWKKFQRSPQAVPFMLNQQAEQQRMGAVAALENARYQRGRQDKLSDMTAEQQAAQAEKAREESAITAGYDLMLKDYAGKGHLTPDQMEIFTQEKDPKRRAVLGKVLAGMGELKAAAAADAAKQAALMAPPVPGAAVPGMATVPVFVNGKWDFQPPQQSAKDMTPKLVPLPTGGFVYAHPQTGQPIMDLGVFDQTKDGGFIKRETPKNEPVIMNPQNGMASAVERDAKTGMVKGLRPLDTLKPGAAAGAPNNPAQSNADDIKRLLGGK